MYSHADISPAADTSVFCGAAGSVSSLHASVLLMQSSTLPVLESADTEAGVGYKNRKDTRNAKIIVRRNDFNICMLSS
ncbi:hypothetical protein D3C79_996030 [compost metagenome]